MQHVNIKIFASKAEIDLVDAIPIFHRWIQENVMPELMIDVADYKHVPEGPGIMLIGYEADYSLNETDGRLGLLYNRKAASTSGPQETLAQAHSAALNACKVLEEEPAFRGKLAFDAGDLLVVLNDRLLAPNSDRTLAEVGPQIDRYFEGVFGPGKFKLQRVGEPRDRFTVAVKRS